MEVGNGVVMLTGAGGRLGRPCALAFAAEGARLLLTDVAASALEETARLVRARGATVLAVPGDVTRRADVEAALDEGQQRLGPVDVLVNFAGYRDMLAATPLGRTGSPEDIAQAVLFLASPRSGWITGEVLFVTGGAHCGRTHMAPAAG